MRRNTEGLKRSARSRREGALARATAALQRMEAADQEINFHSVASEARVSAAWLYSQPELRGRIMRLRKWKSHVALSSSTSQHRESLSRQNLVATLRHRIKTLEVKNRELLQELEVAYGKLMVFSAVNCGESRTELPSSCSVPNTE
jgi:hypothetical protein